MSNFPLRVSPSGPFEDLGEPSVLASLLQYSKFGTGITEAKPITTDGTEVVSVNEAIPNTGAPADGQLFEIDATLAMYFANTTGVPINNPITVDCVLELDNGSTQEVRLPGPGSKVNSEFQASPYAANMPYDWLARVRATVPAERTVIGATVVLTATNQDGPPHALGGSPSPQTLKITRIR